MSMKGTTWLLVLAALLQCSSAIAQDLTYRFAYDPTGPCWQNPAAPTNVPEPDACPSGFEQVDYGAFTANCANGKCACTNWMDCAQQSQVNWGCKGTATPWLPFKVRKCARSSKVFRYVFAYDPTGPCWRTPKDPSRVPEPASCPAGFDQLEYGAITAACGNGKCACTNWMDCAQQSEVKWGCIGTATPWLPLKVRKCGRSSVIYKYVFAYDPTGPCWRNPVDPRRVPDPELCPSEYVQVDYGATTASCANGQCRCTNWMDCAQQSEVKWGCTGPATPWLPLKVRKCAQCAAGAKACVDQVTHAVCCRDTSGDCPARCP
jgi:hypothetical protein